MRRVMLIGAALLALLAGCTPEAEGVKNSSSQKPAASAPSEVQELVIEGEVLTQAFEFGEQNRSRSYGDLSLEPVTEGADKLDQTDDGCMVANVSGRRVLDSKYRYCFRQVREYENVYIAMPVTSTVGTRVQANSKPAFYIGREVTAGGNHFQVYAPGEDLPLMAWDDGPASNLTPDQVHMGDLSLKDAPSLFPFGKVKQVVTDFRAYLVACGKY